MPVNPAVPSPGGSSGTWGTIINAAIAALDEGKADATTFSSGAAGLTPASGGGTTNFLRADGTWSPATPTSQFSSGSGGTVPASGGGTINYLRADGQWTQPPGTGGGGGVGAYAGQFIDVKADFGAAGDALPIDVTMTAGSAAATLTTGTIPASGFSGKRIVVEGAGVGGVPLVTTISTRTDSTHITLAANASLSVSGATAYWGTDDSTAIAAARDSWMNGAIAYTGGANGDRVLQQALFFPPGKYIVTSQDVLLSSPTGGTAAVLRNGLITGAVGTEGSEIIFASTLSTTADPRNGNLITAANRMHGFTIANLKLRSLNANQSFAYLWCTVTQDGTYPNFGSGSQRRIWWDRIDFRGSWNRGIGLDGDSAANLNSEQKLSNIYASDSVTFADALFRSGITSPATNTQQDQFVNYIIENCILEYASGSAFKFEHGGHITVIGGSFVGGVGGSGTVKFFDLVRGGGNWWKCHLQVIGTRFEMRTSGSRVIYSEWRDQIVHVGFENCAISANAVAGDETNMPFIEINNTGGSSVGHGNYRFVNCEIPGYVKFTGATTQSFGRIVFDQCNFTHNWSGLSTEAAATGAIRYAGSFAPKYRFRDCWNITDAAN